MWRDRVVQDPASRSRSFYDRYVSYTYPHRTMIVQFLGLRTEQSQYRRRSIGGQGHAQMHVCSAETTGFHWRPRLRRYPPQRDATGMIGRGLQIGRNCQKGTRLQRSSTARAKACVMCLIWVSRIDVLGRPGPSTLGAHRPRPPREKRARYIAPRGRLHRRHRGAVTVSVKAATSRVCLRRTSVREHNIHHGPGVSEAAACCPPHAIQHDNHRRTCGVRSRAEPFEPPSPWEFCRAACIARCTPNRPVLSRTARAASNCVTHGRSGPSADTGSHEAIATCAGARAAARAFAPDLY